MKNHPLTTAAAFALGTFAFIPQYAAQGRGTDEIAVPHRFTSGTPAVASQVNENFEAVAAGVNAAVSRLELLSDEQTAQSTRLSETDTELETLAAQIAANASASTANSTAITAVELRLRPSRILIVAEENGDFTSIREALESVGDASLSNPVAVQVAPGRYVESDILLVREGVHLQGSGANTTTVVVERSGSFPNESAASVRLFDLSRISGLSVVNSGASALSIGILGFNLSSGTVISDVRVSVEGTAGSGHFAVHVSDSDLQIHDSILVASGATTVNTALASLDGSGAFAQVRVDGSELHGEGLNSGIGAQVSNTALTITNSLIAGDQTGVSATIAGINRLHHSRVRTSGLNPAYTTNGSANVLSAGVEFTAGNSTGVATSFKYVHCYKSNLDPVVNGFGSIIQ